MTTVGQYMTATPHTIGREQPLRAARQLMHSTHVRHLPVLADKELVGVLSEREVELFSTLPGSALFTVEEAMVPDAYIASVDASLEQVAADMARRRIGSAVVVERGAVVGVFTAVDALRALADALRPPLAA